MRLHQPVALVFTGRKGQALDTVGELMWQEPITVRMDRRIGQVLELMSEQHVHHVPVVDEVGRYIGLASEADLRRYGRRGIDGFLLDQVIARCRPARPEDDPIRTFAIQLAERRGATVVVDQDDRPVGLLGEREVLILARNLLPKELFVSDLTRPRSFPVVPPDSPASEALKRLSLGASHVVVADHDGVYGGLDYRRLAGQDDVTVGKLVGRLRRTVRPDTNAVAAVNILSVVDNRCLPVVDGSGNLLSLLTCTDVLRTLTRHLLATSTRPPPPRRR